MWVSGRVCAEKGGRMCDYKRDVAQRAGSVGASCKRIVRAPQKLVNLWGSQWQPVLSRVNTTLGGWRDLRPLALYVSTALVCQPGCFLCFAFFSLLVFLLFFFVAFVVAFFMFFFFLASVASSLGFASHSVFCRRTLLTRKVSRDCLWLGTMGVLCVCIGGPRGERGGGWRNCERQCILSRGREKLWHCGCHGVLSRIGIHLSVCARWKGGGGGSAGDRFFGGWAEERTICGQDVSSSSKLRSMAWLQCPTMVH